MTLLSDAPPAPGAFLVELSELTVSPLNPRKDPSPTELEELRASIRSRGILCPLLVRPVDGHGLEVVAGKRRLLAARAEGLEHVPVMARDMDDETARELGLEEQLQREELDPFEQAEALAELLERRGPAEVGEAIGKPAAWVARRANLAKLSKKWRKAASSGAAKEYTDRHLELVALLDPKDQDLLLRERWTITEGLELAQLRQSVAAYTMRLRAAPWNLDDAELLPRAGACSSCTANSGNAPALFDDWVPEGAKTAEAACRRPSCWAKKREAYRDRRLAKARETHGSELLLLKGPHGLRRGDGLELEAPKNAGTVLDHYQVTTAKKDAPGARPALVVSGEKAGTLRWVKPTSSRGAGSTAKKTKAKKAKATKALTPAKAKAELAEKREQLAGRRQAWTIEHVRERLGKVREHLERRLPDPSSDGKSLEPGRTAPALEVEIPPASLLLQLTAAYGSSSCSHLVDADPFTVAMAPAEMVAELVYLGVLDKVLGELLRSGPGARREEQHVAAQWLGLVLLDATPEQLETAAAEAIPEPKSWEQLEAIAEGRGAAPATSSSTSRKATKKAAKRKKAKATKASARSSSTSRAKAPRRKKATKRKRRTVTR